MHARIWMGFLAGCLAGCTGARPGTPDAGPVAGPPAVADGGTTPDEPSDAGDGADAGSLPDAGPADAPDAGTDDTPDAGPNARGPRPCPDLFAQDLLPTYRVEISSDEWEKLEDEFLDHEERADRGLDPHPWHPIVFRYGDEVVSDAMIRLKGSSSWRLAVAEDRNPKMQFMISFNEVSPKGRFHGLRKIVLDMPRNDRTFLRQRVSLWYLRELGIPAQCANHARLEINGEYYGLFTNLERMDKEFLQRVFPGEDEGDLWKEGDELETNEETSTRERHVALFDADSAAEVETLADVKDAVAVWALDAMLPNSDGYFAGQHNFMLYDHPTRGFVWLPYDLDGTFFGFIPHDANPISWTYAGEKHLHWRLVLASSAWRVAYVDALERALAGYDVTALEANVTAWATQIHAAAADDPHRPFSLEEHDSQVSKLRRFFAKRKAYMEAWLEACDRRGRDRCR